ncbi:MAG TPA: TonB-dependent receptor [Steroidobacteraceae bacterium]|nr:TonB-dependent receptor [Steroidobacteraceae bacterium]
MRPIDATALPRACATAADVRETPRCQRPGVLVALLAFSGALTPVVSAAASSAGEEYSLQEIVVTAQKKAEDTQVVPISITAISADSLALQAGVHDFQDVLTQVSNLSFQYGTGNGNDEQGISQSRGIAIRGISGPNTTSVYINDVPVPVSIDPRLLDINHVEVLKGPQGTLYGQASMGGTVKIVTAQPTTAGVSGLADVDGHYMKGGGGGTFDSLSANVPLSSDTAVRFGGFYSYDPGYLTRTYNDPTAVNGGDIVGPATTIDHVGSQTAYGGTATLNWQPAGPLHLVVQPMFIAERTYSNGFLAADDTASNRVQRRALNVPEYWTDTFYLASLAVYLDTGIGRLISDTSYLYRDSFDQEDGSDVTKLYFGLNHVVPAPSQTDQYNEQLTQEFRLESDIGSALKTTVGAYGNDTLGLFNQNILAPGANDATGGALGSDLGYLADYPIRNYELALFASGTYSITSRLSFSAGLRYSWLDWRAKGTGDGFYNGGPSVLNVGYHAHAATPRFVLQYQVTDDHMVYATAAKGFRPGSGQQLPPICDADLEAIGLPTGTSQIKSDSLWNYELGGKTRWLGGHLTADVAIYDIEWKNIRETVELPTCGFQAAVNGAAARSQGAELEFAWIPVKGLTLGASTGYEDAKITQVAPNSTALFVGQPLSGVPKWTAAANGTFEYPTRSLGTTFLRLDYNFVGQSVSLNNSPIIGRMRPSYRLLNVRAGTRLGDWEYSLYAKNLLNEYANLGDEISEIVEFPSRPRYIVGPPRVIGLEVRKKF